MSTINRGIGMLGKGSIVTALTIALVALALTPVTMTGARAQSSDPVAIALDHVVDNADDLGVARADVTDLAVAGSYKSSHNRVTHVNVSQRFRGLEVFGAYATVNIADDGEVIFVGDSLVDGLSASSSAVPSLAATDALEAAAEELELGEPESLRVVDGPAGRAQRTVLSKAGVSATPIPARLGWHPGKGGLRLAWQLVIDDAADAHLWNATVDANTGDLLKTDDWTDRHSREELASTLARNANAGSALSSPNPVNDGSSYRVFELPKESPNDGPRTLVTNPADAIGSPFGWHDTDGVAGPEFTITRGNNAHAYLDQDNNNGPDFGAPPFEARTGEVFVFSQSADIAYKRLTREIAVPAAGGSLTFWTNYTIEPAWDHLIVEARTAGGDDWTTLPDANGATTQATGQSCPAGWRTLHPHLDRYQTLAAGACTPSGTSGEWHGASGASGGWRQWSVDLSEWTGETVEVSIAYVTDWATLEDGVAIDDVTLPDGTTTSFEAGLDGWQITGPPAGSAANPNNWTRTDPASLPVGDTDGGPGLDFDFPLDLNQHAQNYRDAATTNLYYWNNVVHDVMYRYGFDESSGNFQANNYGRGGTGGDHVRAEAADGGGTNNANFSTPVETPTSGGTPRMQMYLWPGAQFGLPNQVVVDGLGSFDAQFARFSPAPTPAGQPGQRVVYAGTGCDAGLYPAPPSSAWVAIVDGGTTACSYLRRVQVAEALGANGVILAHNTAAAPPIMLSALIGEPVGIPAVSISQADGNAIKAAVAAGPTTANLRKHPNHPGIRDGDLENGIIIHEYGHGISNRLTGPPSTNCLTGNEQAGEGWSDYFAITMLLDPALDDPNEPRGMGPYALFQPDRHGAGIRPRPYSRDMNIQPFTYDSIKTGGWLNGTSLALPHGLGHGWASVLWDLNWDLIDKHGFNPDIYGAWNSGGNNRALQYVIDGLKMQGCGPGLVVASRAIITAADELSDGEDTCTVWGAFARRGLGFSAIQGTTGRDDNTEAFDTHPDCREGFAGISDPPSLNTLNRGSSVDMVFDAGGDRGLGILTETSPYSREVDCETLRTVTPGAEFTTPRPVPVAAQTPGNARLSYNPQTGRYTFPWKTEQGWGGTCREFVLTRDDGVQHRAYFRFQASPAMRLDGRVLDAAGGPVPNARVTLRGGIFRATRAGANGAYSFDGLPTGVYEATASGGGCYEQASQQVDLTTRHRTVDFTLSGRSDTFGNTCRLESSAFEEAANALPLAGDDEALTIDLPFTFNHYGFPYRRAHVCTNGFIEFVGPAASNCSASNAAIPTTGRPNGAIYSFWDDLNVDAQSSVRTEAKGSAPNRRFVVEYRNVQFFEDTSGRRIDFNIVLHENGQIQTQYRNIANDGRESGSEATIGIENHAGNDALRFSHNAVALGPEPSVTSLRYTPPPLPPAQTVSGRVVGDDGQPVRNATVTIEDTPITPASTDANGFYSFEDIPEGTYEATAAATGCNTTETKPLVVSGPTTLDFTLAERSDAFGHTCALEDAPYEEADTVLPITGDAGVGAVDLPFPVTFYGFAYTRAYVCTNGFVEFVGPATTNCSSTNAAIPTTGRPNGAIYPLWDNLAIDAAASIRADVRGEAPNRRFVIEFRNAQFPPSTTARVDFNVVLHESGDIVTQYRNIADVPQERGSGATIGIENHAGNDALRVALNQAVLPPSAVTTIRYDAPPAPPSHPVSGRVTGADGQPIENATVTVDGTPITPATTDANGAYSFARVPQGTFNATAVSPCNGPETEQLVVSGPTTLNFTLPSRTDAFGYTCAPENGGQFETADTVLALTGDDEATTIDLPFAFSFYGQTHTQAHVCTNGFIEFVGPTTTSCPAGNAAIPTTGRPNGAIFAYWDDTFVDAEASVRTDVRGEAPNRRFVIEWRNVHYFQDTTRRVDFNMVLFENGQILTQHRNLANDERERGNSATLGIENHAGTTALRYSFNQAVLATEPAVSGVRYRPPAGP